MKNKKILIIGSNDGFSLEKMYFRGFKSLGCNITFLHAYSIQKNFINKFIWKYLRFVIFKLIKNKITRHIVSNKKFYDLIIIFKGIYLNDNFILNIKKLSPGTKLINIFPDDPFDTNYFKDISNNNVIRSIKHFDHVFIFSKKILKKLKNKFPKNDFSFLPFANDNFLHKKFKITNKPIYDLSFIGTADKDRYNLLKQLSEFKIILAGNGWERFNIPQNIKYIKSVNFFQFAKTISKSKISLNILRNQNKKSHNMKTFEIPAMGGLMLTEKTSEQQDFFPENKACLMYENINDLKKKLKLVKKNHNKFNKIKKLGFKLSKRHSYKIRAIFVLKKSLINV